MSISCDHKSWIQTAWAHPVTLFSFWDADASALALPLPQDFMTLTSRVRPDCTCQGAEHLGQFWWKQGLTYLSIAPGILLHTIIFNNHESGKPI